MQEYLSLRIRSEDRRQRADPQIDLYKDRGCTRLQVWIIFGGCHFDEYRERLTWQQL